MEIFHLVKRIKMNELIEDRAEKAFELDYPDFYNLLKMHRKNAMSISWVDTIMVGHALLHFKEGYIAGHNSVKCEGIKPTDKAFIYGEVRFDEDSGNPYGVFWYDGRTPTAGTKVFVCDPTSETIDRSK